MREVTYTKDLFIATRDTEKEYLLGMKYKYDALWLSY